MNQAQNDLAVIKDYLIGEKTAFDFVDKSIGVAFSKWAPKMSDIKSEVYSDVHYKLLTIFRADKFRGDSKLITFISRIVSNTCIDYIRARSRFVNIDIVELDIPEDKPGPDKLLEIKENAWLTFRVLRRLPRECISMWRMSVTKRLSSKKIGDLLGLSESNVRRRMMQCRNRAKEIRKKLQEK